MTKIRNTIRLCSLLFFIISSARFVHGQIHVASQNDSLIQSGIELSIQHDYEGAEAIFQQMIEDEPDNPAGYFFMAATIQSKMMDFEADTWEQDFHRYIQLAIHHAKEKRADGKKDSWSLFYRGSAQCYLAFYESRKGDYLAAVRHGLSGISALKKVVDFQPEFYDAYFGIGSYKYWRSQVTRYLNWLPLIADERKEGLHMVLQAVEQGKFTRDVAMNELIWILLDAGRHEEAYFWALKGLEKFPQSRFFLWGAAKSSFALGQYHPAANHYQQLLNSIANARLNNHYNEYICHVNLARCFAELGNYAEAVDQIQIVESLSLSPDLEKKLKKQHKLVQQLKKRLYYVAGTEQHPDSSISKNEFADKQRRQHTSQVTE